jgi:uncharacterized protein YjbI with pentapeptide repeats
LEGADFRLAKLLGTHLAGAKLKGANLRSAYLKHADFSGADLRDADLREALLERARLFLAHLEGADLRDTDVTQTEIQLALGDAKTLLPDGLVRPPAWTAEANGSGASTGRSLLARLANERSTPTAS